MEMPKKVELPPAPPRKPKEDEYSEDADKPCIPKTSDFKMAGDGKDKIMDVKDMLARLKTKAEVIKTTAPPVVVVKNTEYTGKKIVGKTIGFGKSVDSKKFGTKKTMDFSGSHPKKIEPKKPDVKKSDTKKSDVKKGDSKKSKPVEAKKPDKNAKPVPVIEDIKTDPNKMSKLEMLRQKVKSVAKEKGLDKPREPVISDLQRKREAKAAKK